MTTNTRNLVLLLIIGLVALVAVFVFANDREDYRVPEAAGPAVTSPIPADTATVVVYHYDAARDTENGNVLCSERGLVAVPHTIEATDAPLRAVLEILLAGEPAQPGLTPFPQGVILERVAVDDGVATVVLDDPGHRTSGGACQVSILRAQLERTVLQFPHITEVRIEPEELFQP